MAIVFSLVCACSPSRRIARILKRHPELVKTDTIYQERTILVPGYSFTDSTKQSTNTKTIDSLLAHIQPKNDTIYLQKIKREIVTQFMTKPCLDGPKTFYLPDSTKLILTQKNGNFYISGTKPTTYVKAKVPVQTNTVKLKPAMDWSTFLNGVFIGWIIAIIVLLIYAKGGKA